MSSISNIGGFLTFPNKPYIFASNNGTADVAAGNQLTTFTTEISNGITHSSGTFTVPIAGLYRIHHSVLAQATGTSGAFGVALYINDAQVARISYGSEGNTESWSMLTGMSLRELSANDTIKFYSSNNTISIYGSTDNNTIGGVTIILEA